MLRHLCNDYLKHENGMLKRDKINDTLTANEVKGGFVISSINSKGNSTDINVLPFVIPIIGVSPGIGLIRCKQAEAII